MLLHNVGRVEQGWNLGHQGNLATAWVGRQLPW